MNVEFLAPAADESEEAYSFYEARQLGLGAEFRVELERALQLIVAHPMAWARTSGAARQCRLNRFPSAVVYRVRADDIIAIAHFRRQPRYWKDRLKQIKPSS